MRNLLSGLGKGPHVIVEVFFSLRVMEEEYQGLFCDGCTGGIC